MFLAFAAKGRFRTCAPYFGAGTVFHPFWQFILKVDMNPTHTCDRTEIGAFELTIPALVKTMTEVSMLTVTRLSMETTTVEGACSATAVGLFLFSSRILHGFKLLLTLGT